MDNKTNYDNIYGVKLTPPEIIVGYTVINQNDHSNEPFNKPLNKTLEDLKHYALPLIMISLLFSLSKMLGGG